MPDKCANTFGRGGIKMSVGQFDTSNEDKHNNNKKVVKCRHCKNTDVVKKGYRQTMMRGKIQRWFCHRCKKSFTVDEGFFRMKNNEKVITMSVDMYLSDMSSRKMRNQLRRHMETRISHVTVLDWVRKYCLKVYKFTQKFKPQLGGRYYMDETEIDCAGRNDNFWCCVDWDTRFIPNTHYSLFTDKRNAVEFLENVKKTHLPKYVQTDAANFYPFAFEKVFSKEVEHKINNTAQTGKHNVRIETVFSKLKDRIREFRGLKAFWSAPILLNGLIIQHNFIEAHTTTGRIPCELAGMKFEAGVNKWLGLIHLSSEN